MQKTVPFADREEARASDFNAIQENMRFSMDRLISDAVTRSSNGYVGFNVTKSATTQLGIATGRIYRPDGAMFALEQPDSKSVVSILPAATKKMVAVVAYGQEEDSKTEVRDFLVDLENDTTQPKTVVVERRRSVVIDLIPGQETAMLTRPAIQSGLLVLAWVTLGTAGIDAIEMEQSTTLSSVYQNSVRIKALEAWRSQVEPRLATIASDITGLKTGLQGRAEITDLVNVMRDLARVKEQLQIPDSNVDYAADRFLDYDESDKANIDFLALVEEGIRFPAAAQAIDNIALYNPLDSNAYVVGNFILPAINSAISKRVDTKVGDIGGSIFIAQYGFQTHTMKQISVARERLRFGTAYSVCNNSSWWKNGQYDSAKNTFTKDGETFLVTGQQILGKHNIWNSLEKHSLLRVQQYWVDKWTEKHWVAKTTNRTVSGAQIAQTFLVSQDGWLANIQIRLTEKGPDGDLHASICEVTDDGVPDTDALLAHVTVPYASLKAGTSKTNNNADTQINFPPTFMEAGNRYALLLTTLGSHKIAVTDSNDYAQGTLFYSTDGVYFAGDLARDLYFDVNFLTFKSSRVELELKALSLSGGIANIDVIAPKVIPGSGSIVHHVLINGKWRPIDSLTPNMLVGLPPLLRHKAVFTGTKDVQPAIMMEDTQVKVWRQRTNFRHVSIRRNLATTATNIKVTLTLADFDAAHHTITCRLKKDDGTFITASGFSDRLYGSRIERTFAFVASPAISFYRIDIQGTTDNALVPFHIEERVDVAL